jgi:DNA-directed RNA polymerase II subunit RPB1
MYEIDISSKYAALYKEHIGTKLHEDKLNDILEYLSRQDIITLREDIDKIEGLGNIIAECGKTLNLPGQSRNFGRWAKKESIGRRTLEKYIGIFESHEKANLITNQLAILRQAAYSNVIWDEITTIEIYTPDQSIYVYDFTVPGNQTFMIDNGIIVHNTLNTKHSAGVASKSLTTGGVPRIEELLHYSRDIKTPQMTIYFDKEISNDRSKINKISSYLTYLTIKELISGAEIYYDTGSEMLKNDEVSNPFFINNQKVELSSLPFVFRIKLNMEKMHDKETTLLDIKTKFISHWTKYFTNLKTMKKNEKDIFMKISRCAILSNNNVENQIIHIRFNMSSFNYNLLTDFLKIVLEQITLKGIDNITSSDLIHERKLNFNSDNGNMDVDKEYIVYTSGINMEKVKYIKGINNSLTTCNDVSTIYRLYGIEAARQILINEFMTTFNSGGSKSVNHSHMSVLIDMMTHLGFIISIDRHGLDKVESEPIAKASFEKQMDHFLNAALFNQKDNIQSVSSRIMLGRVIPGGTGAFELMLDTDKLENSEYTKNENGGRITFPALEEETLFKDILKYGFSKDDFFLPV